MLTSYSIPGIVILENQAEIDGSLIQSFGAFSGTPSTDGISGVKLYAHLGNGDRVDITSGSGGKSVAWFELADGRIVLGIEGTTAIANVAQIADDGQTIVEFEFSRAQNYSGQRLVDPYLQTSGGSLSGAFPPQPDGIVSGTSGDDLIETTYTDDAGGDRVDGPENDSNNAMTAITAIDTAIETVNTQRSKLGAVSNRLTHTLNNLTNISANLSAARGGIEDADFAFETTQLAKNQILQQASTAMLAQANASKQNVLSLLQG